MTGECKFVLLAFARVATRNELTLQVQGGLALVGTRDFWEYLCGAPHMRPFLQVLQTCG
jgi:hypothetical protein